MEKKTFFITVTTLIVFIGLFMLINKLNKDDLSIIPSLIPRTNDSNVSAEYLNAQRTVDFYRKKIENNSEDSKNYVELAQVYLQEARVTGLHHEYMVHAEILINTALGIDPGNFEALVTKATLLMIYHRFNDAKKLVLKAIGQNPYNSAAYGVLCDSYVETGDYENAVKTCDKMLSIHPDIKSYSRASYLREIYGELDASIEAMKLAADAGMTGQESRSWALYNLGNLFFISGKIDTAAFIYNGILEERPGYAYAYSGLSKIMIAKGNYTKAIEYLVKASQIIPDHIFIEQLGYIYLIIGEKESEEEMIKKVLQTFEQHESDGWNVNREFSQFCSIHNIKLSESLERIKGEYEKSPDNYDVLKLYAWLLYKNKQNEKALHLIKKAAKFGRYDPMFHYYAGLIFDDAGKKKDALKYLQKSFDEILYIHPLAFEDARSRISSLEQIVYAH
ncbi:MAG: tetratricopeptide repeat protein [Bacteroidetes bacterium]|nr:tetratricopeptide repeat protein [Bacteroidota bacterium]